MHSQTEPCEVPARHSRLLVVETDELTAWSLSAYLRRWFAVEAATSAAAAVKVLRARPTEAVVVSDQVPSEAVETIVRVARLAKPEVRTVLLAAGDADPRATPPCATRIEKPFALPDLARLLGVPEEELIP